MEDVRLLFNLVTEWCLSVTEIEDVFTGKKILKSSPSWVFFFSVLFLFVKRHVVVSETVLFVDARTEKSLFDKKSRLVKNTGLIYF